MKQDLRESVLEACPRVTRGARWSALGATIMLLGCSVSEGTPGVASAGNGQGGTAAAGAGAAGTGVGGGVSGAAPGAPEIAHKPIHRLSGVEYDNTLRDLTGTALRFGHGFASEEADGFDNIAAALTMSPRQVEAYFVAAQKVSADVFAQPALRDRIVTCTPDASNACAEAVIRDFGLRAFRRPITPSESSALLGKLAEAQSLGATALEALEHVVHIMLASPQFLYRIEHDPNLTDPTPHALDGYELASRLSYALWSSMPDDGLLQRAAEGAISEPAGLLVEAQRLLADPRSEMLVKNFAAQWLGSNRLAEHVASSTIFPDYGPDLAASMQQEMELYVSEFLHSERPYTEFLSADLNFVDARLAPLYGMTPPAMPGLVRVTEPNDARSGFLGLAGFLTHTSRETRTSPIIRGKWILDAVWCMKLEVPADLVIEALPEPTEGAPPTTVREQIAAHRASASCAGCHNLIDPIGLALENFDAIGRYRSVYENGLAIDAKGVMPSGDAVDGLASLATALGKDPRFLSCAAAKFGTYALGQAFPAANRDQIVARWSAGVPTLRSLIEATVTHESFRLRRAEAP
jgi:Protein of unknown function (DUF1592)/Protein of unknown function (DUF1588)/Protein of unknown function (DUF1587)/Protein of unknown function (DUF1595)/Protein of unknown function (DUF1585)